MVGAATDWPSRYCIILYVWLIFISKHCRGTFYPWGSSITLIVGWINNCFHIIKLSRIFLFASDYCWMYQRKHLLLSALFFIRKLAVSVLFYYFCILWGRSWWLYLSWCWQHHAHSTDIRIYWPLPIVCAKCSRIVRRCCSQNCIAAWRMHPKI